ncbi:MAG: hypothetical protein FK734_15970 [Asgard group archaeon]|nr:hypothetical protein [Asgard group archaeon]
MSEELSLQDKVSTIKKLTDVLLKLPDSFSLDNGWDKRDLLLHLWTWDMEYIRLCSAKLTNKLSKFQYEYESMNMTYSVWNDYNMEKYFDLSYDEVKLRFQESRGQLIGFFEKLIKTPEIKVPKDNFLTTRILNIYQHDKMHLEAGGVAIYLD